MKFQTIILLLAVCIISSCRGPDPDLIIACGWDEVFIHDLGFEVPQKTWSWTAGDAENLPVYMRNKFLTTDDCKPVNNGKDILITSSGGGVALINIETKNASFWASVPNAHTAELLPGGYIAVAASLSSEGNRINVYNITEPEIVCCSDSLYSAHGLIWDERRDYLWALGYDVLRCYTFNAGKTVVPELKMVNEYIIPGKGGHDLMFIGSRNEICLTTEENVYMFDIDSESFSLHPLIGNEKNVKSVSYNSNSRRTAYMKASEENWWGYYIRFAETDRVIYLPYERLYKVRWLYPD